jgi:hypothetical protein
VSGDLVALLVAALGMLGTLSSPIVAQRLSARTKREESDAQRRDALEGRDHTRRETLAKEKKAAYVAFNAAARRYRIELMNRLHEVGSGTPGEAGRGELRDSRRAYSLGLAEMQIVASDSVMEVVEQVTSNLYRAYKAIKSLEDGTPDPGWSFEETQDHLIHTWDHWASMRKAMRNDLGLDESSESIDEM